MISLEANFDTIYPLAPTKGKVCWPRQLIMKAASIHIESLPKFNKTVQNLLAFEFFFSFRNADSNIGAQNTTKHSTGKMISNV